MNRMELAPRPGVSLVETLVAITLMAVVLSGLGGLAFSASRQTVNLAATNLRQGVLAQEVNRLTAWPFDQLPGAAGCTTVTTGPLPHQRCVTVTSMGNMRRVVQVIVTPNVAGVAPDTIRLERTRAPVGSVLSTL